MTFAWRGAVGNDELTALHAEGFGRPPAAPDWVTRLTEHSLGRVGAREGATLVGFVDVVWDGGVHAFVLDTAVAATHRRRGLGTRLLAVARAQSRAAGCEWLPVDFEPHPRGFYLPACGFRETDAGLIALR